MSAKSDFSPAHWTSLVQAGPAIARAVSASAGASGQSETELAAYAAFVSDATVEEDRDSLLGQLAWDVNAWLASGGPLPDDDPYVDGLEAARRAGAILSVAAEPDDADAVRTWLLAGATRVAQAAREGSLLGLGGEEVSRWERETLAAIRDALGIDAGG